MIQNDNQSFPLQTTNTLSEGDSEAPVEEGYSPREDGNSPREEGYSPRETSVSAQSLSPGHDVDYVNPRGVRFTSHHRGMSM